MAAEPTLHRPDTVEAPRRSGTTVRRGTLFGAHPGSVRIAEGEDIVRPALRYIPEAETGAEVAR